MIDRPNRGDVAIYVVAMVLLVVIGLVGFLLHVRFDLTTQNVIVPERFMRGAPFLAPMLFANMGLVGLITILDPVEPGWQPSESGEEKRQPAVMEA